MVVVAGGSWTEGKGENRPNTSVSLSVSWPWMQPDQLPQTPAALTSSESQTVHANCGGENLSFSLK